MSTKNQDKSVTTDKDTKNKSFFSCCGCGDKETNKEAYVDINEKVPDRVTLQPYIVDDRYKLKTTAPVSIVQRPSSLPKVRNTALVKPKIMFTYTSPNT